MSMMLMMSMTNDVDDVNDDVNDDVKLSMKCYSKLVLQTGRVSRQGPMMPMISMMPNDH